MLISRMWCAQGAEDWAKTIVLGKALNTSGNDWATHCSVIDNSPAG